MKNKEIEVWKVLSYRSRASVGVDPKSPFLIRYPIGELVKPKVGKIFCFKKKEDAKKFIVKSKKENKWSIHKAIAINPKPIYVMAFDEGNIKKFWKGSPSGCYTPNGSYVCDALKCLE